MERVLVTGAAGFIGSNLVDYLLAETEWFVEGVDNLSTGNVENLNEALRNERFSFLQVDACQIDSLKPYSKVFHLAALPRIQPSFDLITEHITANVLLGAHFIELMIKENHFPRFIYSGSSAIYGTPNLIPTPETERIDCLSPYAFQKYEMERYLELISTRYPLDYVTLRYFNPYGPRSFNPKNEYNAYSSVVGIFLNRKKQGKKLLITGDGFQERDFIHVKDLAKANYLAAVYPRLLNTSFNIGFGSTLSIFDLAKMISQDFAFIDRREGEAQITFADNEKAKSILNWTPTENIEEYLKSEMFL